jgi:hypothetical protein
VAVMAEVVAVLVAYYKEPALLLEELHILL